MSFGLDLKEIPQSLSASEVMLPLSPDCFYRLLSFTKSIDVRPNNQSVFKDLKNRTIVYYNSRTPGDTYACKVLFTEIYPSIIDFLTHNEKSIGKVYPGLMSKALAQKLFDDTYGVSQEVISINLNLPLSFGAVEPFSKKVRLEESCEQDLSQESHMRAVEPELQNSGVNQEDFWIVLKGRQGSEEGGEISFP